MRVAKTLISAGLKVNDNSTPQDLNNENVQAGNAGAANATHDVDMLDDNSDNSDSSDSDTESNDSVNIDDGFNLEPDERQNNPTSPLALAQDGGHVPYPTDPVSAIFWVGSIPAGPGRVGEGTLLLKELIQTGAPVDALMDGPNHLNLRPLNLASKLGLEEEMRILIDVGANVNGGDDYGMRGTRDFTDSAIDSEISRAFLERPYLPLHDGEVFLDLILDEGTPSNLDQESWNMAVFSALSSENRYILVRTQREGYNVPKQKRVCIKLAAFGVKHGYLLNDRDGNDEHKPDGQLARFIRDKVLEDDDPGFIDLFFSLGKVGGVQTQTGIFTPEAMLCLCLLAKHLESNCLWKIFDEHFCLVKGRIPPLRNEGQHHQASGILWDRLGCKCTHRLGAYPTHDVDAAWEAQ
ncbi:hypothetical protein QBC38DRAFT_461206 [Podospora fimiseda]|uniref:Ankyrin repeat protein n=1 Tax=Podospora fimiseda TaxID=252190 RepID=A0AAN6YMV0_9PEZI|nr:hypothetical protein QBC38DRAFT_461206 [Podospora fimiseda]